MFFPEGNVRVFLHQRPVDMRRSFTGLSGRVRQVLEEDPLSGTASRSHPSYAQLGVTSAAPVDRHDRFIGRDSKVEHDILDAYARKPLLRSHIRTRRVPHGRQVMSKGHQRRTVNPWTRGRGLVYGGDSLLELSHTLERSVPTRSSSCATSRLVGSTTS